MSAIEQIIPDGYKQTEIGIIPENWNVKTLDSITGTKRPISYGIVQTGPHLHDGIPCLRVLDIVNGSIKTDNLIRTTHKISNAYKRTQLKENDLVIPLRGKVGEVGIIGKELVRANLTRGVALIALEGEFVPQFLKQALCSEGSQNRLLNSMNGSALQEISIGTLRSFKIFIPERPEEQTAIANALSDMDALLTELEKLIAKKQAIKTATMQQLLTGKTRLPQFATYTEGTVEGKRKGTKPSELGVIPEDWDVVCINEIATLIGDGIHSTPTYDSNGDYYFVNGNNIHRGKLKLTENTNKVSEAEFKKHKKNINERTLFLSINGTIGNLAYYKNEPIILGKSAAFINIKTSTNLEYAYHMLSHEETQQRFEDGLTGSTIKNLGLGTIKSTLIPIPKLEEQTAIATILSDMDNEIQTLEQRLAKTRQIKQGMMQQLLTGRTRLPFKRLETEKDGGS